MKTRVLRLSKPVYELLPWAYILGGLFALIVSYGQRSAVLSVIVGLPGLVAVLGGLVVLLRRRDYRAMRAHYDRPDALSEPNREGD